MKKKDRTLWACVDRDVNLIGKRRFQVDLWEGRKPIEIDKSFFSGGKYIGNMGRLAFKAIYGYTLKKGECKRVKRVKQNPPV